MASTRLSSQARPNNRTSSPASTFATAVTATQNNSPGASARNAPTRFHMMRSHLVLTNELLGCAEHSVHLIISYKTFDFI
jgi:hypothetical protein